MSKILIVDDRPENRLALEALLLSEGGYEISFAGGGNEALRFLLKNPDVSLVLMDVHMPDMDGYEAASLMQQTAATRTIPVVFVTAEDAGTTVPERYQAALSNPVFLHKPITPGAMQAILKTLEY